MPERKIPTKARSTPPPRQHGIRLPSDLSAQLETIARAENNSVSSVMRRLITRALAATSGDKVA